MADAPADGPLSPVGIAPFEDQDRWRAMGFPFIPLYDNATKGNTPTAYAVEPEQIVPVRRGGSLVPPVAVVGDAAGRPIGFSISTHCALRFRLENEPKRGAWRGNEVLSDPGVPLTELRKDAERLASNCARYFQKVTLNFRLTSREDEGVEERRLETYGLAIGKRRLLVPESLDREAAARIDTIDVDILGVDPKSPPRKIPGTFLCAYKTFGAFVVEVPEDLPAALSFGGTGNLPFLEPCFAISAQEKSGVRKIFADLTRGVFSERGHQDRLDWVVGRPYHEGAAFFSREGRMLALSLRPRKEDEERRAVERGRPHRSGSTAERIFPLAELREMLENPRAFQDERIVLRTKEDEKQRVWMGVEFSPLNKDLAKALGIERATKDGAIGCIVYHVYPGSPAEKMGLKPEDVILRIRDPKGVTTELPSAAAEDDPDFFSMMEMMEDVDLEEMDLEEDIRLWPDRDNFLTRLLMAIGPGKKIEIAILSGGREVAKEMEIQRSPPDFDSAPKYQNKDIGLTVKAVTYEVSWYFHADPGKGVIVSKIEPGSPAAIARIRTFEFIVAADGRPVDGPAAFRGILEKALADRRESVNLTVVNILGKSRFADLKLAKPPGKGAP